MARVAKSLEKLRAQLNALYPNRSKVSDGGIGDLAHSKRKSDHNPNNAGVVTARDFTFDTDPSDGVGIDCELLAQTLIQNKDPRIKYLIWNHRITKKDKSGWERYTGPNAHTKHLHISVSSNPALYDDDSDWKLNLSFAPTKLVESQESRVELSKGSKGAQVKILQQYLAKKGYLKSSDVDSIFGQKTESALRRFQLANGLTADGVFGPKTARALGL